MSECVVLRLSLPGAVVTYSVTVPGPPTSLDVAPLDPDVLGGDAHRGALRADGVHQAALKLRLAPVWGKDQGSNHRRV